MRQTELSLNRRDRRIVDEFRSKGLHMAREFNRAHILAALDSKLPEQRIMEILNVGRTAIWRTRSAYLEGGWISRSTMHLDRVNPNGIRRRPRRRGRRWLVSIRPRGSG